MSARACLAALCLLPLLAHAGQTCEARKLTVDELRQSLALAASTAQALDRSGAQVVVLARAGQDLSDYRLRYSHLGIAYRDDRVWRVVHKLNQCGSDRGDLYRQGLAGFFSDGLYRYEAGVVVLDTAVQARILPALKDNAHLSQLHEPRYNMVAYPWNTQYQQSNQWAIETLALLIDPSASTRRRAQAWLRQRDYRPSTIEISAMKRFGARVGTAHIDFDDHPFGRRMAGHIDTVTVDSVFDWLHRSGLGTRAQTIASHGATRQGHPPNGLILGDRPGSGM
ncbi:MAG: DUF2145 domain-containing protein [Denitromonas halophila]|nr:MAG: DUF2145 domain-containing protein [Denitromonas halophila]